MDISVGVIPPVATVLMAVVIALNRSKPPTTYRKVHSPRMAMYQMISDRAMILM